MSWILVLWMGMGNGGRAMQVLYFPDEATCQTARSTIAAEASRGNWSVGAVCVRGLRP